MTLKERIERHQERRFERADREADRMIANAYEFGWSLHSPQLRVARGRSHSADWATYSWRNRPGIDQTVSVWTRIHNWMFA